MKLQFFLYVIILGLVINLLANMIWKYIPGTNRHIDKIATAALVGICIILLALHQEDRSSDVPQQKIEIGDHATGVLSNIGGTQIIATHSNVTIGQAVNDLSATTCMIDAKVTSDVVSRVFFRGAFRPEGGEQTLQPTSQELFYEWKVFLSANENARDISLELHQLQASDLISIHPPSAGVPSEPSKRWYSGFPEPHRSKPDYLFRTVRFPHLSLHSPTVAVTIRRFLAKPLLSSNDLIKIENATASSCQVQVGDIGQAQDAERLQGLAKALAENVYQMRGIGSPVPIRNDPGDLEEHETQATIEMRCKNQSCSNMEARQLEARLGKSPYEYAKEQQTEQLQQLKKDLKTALGCVEGPLADPHPTRDSHFIQSCGDPAHLSAEDMQRLLSLFQKHGVQLDIMTPKDSPGSATHIP